MSDLAIRLHGLGKRYAIGGPKERHSTLRDTVAEAVKSTLRHIRQPYVGAHPNQYWALRDVSFDVTQGEIVGIIGRNGAGKSTLLRLLSRITVPTEGRAEVSGRVGSLLEVGTGFHPELTGRENIYLNGAILGMKKAEINLRFDEIVDFAGVNRFLDTPVKRYSSGMYVRLAFAVAAHLDPDILIVDEVLAVGDAAFQKKCLGRMGEAAKEGRTVLFVSHNMTSIRSLCERAILLDEGRVKTDGEAAQVVQTYLTTGDSTAIRKTFPRHLLPGNGSFEIVSVALKDSSGSDVSAINISEDAIVEIEHEVSQDGARVGFSLVLFDSEGNCIFGSLSNKEAQYYGKPLKRGTYVSRCRLYGNLLNSGRFSVSIIGFSANWSDGFRADNVVSFEAIDDGVLRGDYFQSYGGALRPRLQWETVAMEPGPEMRSTAIGPN